VYGSKVLPRGNRQSEVARRAGGEDGRVAMVRDPAGALRMAAVWVEHQVIGLISAGIVAAMRPNLRISARMSKSKQDRRSFFWSDSKDMRAYRCHFSKD
jgi:hypothetical protein